MRYYSPIDFDFVNMRLSFIKRKEHIVLTGIINVGKIKMMSGKDFKAS